MLKYIDHFEQDLVVGDEIVWPAGSTHMAGSLNRGRIEKFVALVQHPSRRSAYSLCREDKLHQANPTVYNVGNWTPWGDESRQYVILARTLDKAPDGTVREGKLQQITNIDNVIRKPREDKPARVPSEVDLGTKGI